MKKSLVAVALSGGVDSSVSAFLLKESGYDVIALFMKNWDEEDEDCPQQKDYEDVIAVCQHLKIPFYTLNFTQEYWDGVFTEFLEDIKLGYTPNPDVLCNREIKFKVLSQKALSLGADFLATGHYARIQDNALLKGKDPLKDQTYFLYGINRNVLQKTLFPVGGITKQNVRAIAKQQGIATHDKKDSTGICFVGKRRFAPFLRKYVNVKNGPIMTIDGKVIGEHIGAIYYTIGQRKGLNIGGPGEAWFVVSKNIPDNIVIVAQGENHPALFKKNLTATDINWLIAPPSLPLRCKAKIRYRQNEQPCIVEKIDSNTLKVSFDEPQRAITPRQAVVFYQGDICLGGGLIGKLNCG